MKIRAGRGKWTYEDYLLLPEDGKRHEIIWGDKLVTPAPTPRHQLTSGNLEHALRTFVEASGVGVVYYSPIDVVLGEDTVVQPDILFVFRERIGIVGERAITGAPDLVIEIASESTRRTDYQRKRELYGSAGVREYWIVDPDIERVEIFWLEEGRLVKKAEVSGADSASSTVLPGFQVALERIFRGPPRASDPGGGRTSV